MTKHTATPWKAGKAMGLPCIEAENSKTVIAIFDLEHSGTSRASKEVNKANRDYVVKCVNEYETRKRLIIKQGERIDELVDTLKWVLAQVTELYHIQTRKEIQEALSKAESEN